MKPTIGKTESGEDLVIDIPRLLLTRMLVQASSGGGKSYALRRILEQTASHVQQIILDIEGEFTTLREKFDYIICAPYGADVVATPQTATILARHLRETRASAIIDMYEMKMPDRKKFVRLFLEEFVESPKSMWHPCIVVLDEAHHFCPEKDEAESMAAVNDLITRGRKRGLCGLLATQRLSKLNKDSAAELHNKLIGLAVLDTDVKRASDDLGMTVKESMPILRSLDPGEFFTFGPALTRTVTKITVGPVITTHPEAGSGATLAPPPPSAKVKALLAKLVDLPKEAEQEARTLADMKRENTNLKRELTLAKKEQPKAPATEIKRVEIPILRQGEIKQLKRFIGIIENCAKHYNDAKHTMESALWNVETISKQINEILTKAANTATDARKLPYFVPVTEYTGKMPIGPAEIGSFSGRTPATVTPQRKADAGNDETNLTPMDRAILTVLAQFSEEGCRANKLVLLAGYTLNGSTRNSFSKLRSAGFIVGGNTGTIRITQEGMDAIGSYDSIPMQGNELRNYWLNHKILTPMDRAILQTLINNPEGMEAEPLCVEAGYTLNGSTRNSLSKLRTAGLIVGKNTDVIRAVTELARRQRKSETGSGGESRTENHRQLLERKVQGGSKGLRRAGRAGMFV